MASLTEGWVHQHAPGMSTVDEDENKTNMQVRDESDAHVLSSALGGFQGNGSSLYHRYPMRPPELYHSRFSAHASTFEPRLPAPRLPAPVPRHNSSGPRVNFNSPGAEFVPPSTGGSSSKNEVDSWIDDLDPRKPMKSEVPTEDDVSSAKMMGFFVQQSLPRMEIPEFDGSPVSYIEFITKIRDLVHNQPFLSDIQCSTQYGKPFVAIFTRVLNVAK